MGLATFKGGVHPFEGKELSMDKPVTQLKPTSGEMVYPLSQHIGAPAKPLVKVGDEKKLVEVTDEDDVYSGCYGFVSVNFFPFNNAGNKGVAAGLNNVLKTRDGDYLGGRTSATSDFGGMDLSQYGEDEDDIF